MASLSPACPLSWQSEILSLPECFSDYWSASFTSRRKYGVSQETRPQEEHPNTTWVPIKQSLHTLSVGYPVRM